MKISELRPGMSNVALKAEVVSIDAPREISKIGRTLRVADATLQDDSGSITMSLWEENIDKVNVGSKVKIENAFVRTWQNKPQLTLGKFGKIEVIE